MSKDDWPNFRVSDEYDHKLAYHAAKGQHTLPSCSTYRPWRVTASKDEGWKKFLTSKQC
jgi:hypothetical protein